METFNFVLPNIKPLSQTYTFLPLKLYPWFIYQSLVNTYNSQQHFYRNFDFVTNGLIDQYFSV